MVIIYQPASVCVCADVKAIMQNAGNSLMSHGMGSGKGRAIAAATAAISSPLLDAGINDATGCVWNITGPADLSLREVNEAADIINEVADPSADIIFGAVVDETLQNEVRLRAAHACVPAFCCFLSPSVSRSGTYPWDITLRQPLAAFSLLLHSHSF